jgi:hypothetical protein
VKAVFQPEAAHSRKITGDVLEPTQSMVRAALDRVAKWRLTEPIAPVR